MNAGGLRVCVGHGRVRVPGFLSLDERDDADVPYRAGDAFPFTDRAIEAIVVAGFDAHVHESSLVAIALECRRVLRVQGAVRFVMPATASAARDARLREAVDRVARLVGLLPASNGQPPAMLDFTKPQRQASGQPLVTIAIPAYSARFFAAALDSALAQTYPHVEIVVCDDSSEDAIASIVAARNAELRVRYERNPVRLKGRGNYRRCLELAHGEFLKYLNDDDVLEPDCVARLVEAFVRVPDLALATSHRLRIDAFGSPLDDQPATRPVVDRDRIVAGPTLANAMLMAGINFIGEPTTVLFRKGELADQAPEYFRFHGRDGRGLIDMTTWAALLMKGDAAFIAARLSRFRIHEGQQQRDPDLVQRSTIAMRGLQAEWLSLGLERCCAPDRLMVKPYGGEDADDWVSVPLAHS